MLARLKIFFVEAKADPAAGAQAFDRTQIATAALLVHAACLDQDFGPDEERTIAEIITTSFDLTAEEAEELLALGQQAETQANDLFGWTRDLKDALSPDQKQALIEKLWEVVYADGSLHDYEANLLRRIAGLIYVPDRDVGDARRRVLERLNLRA